MESISQIYIVYLTKKEYHEIFKEVFISWLSPVEAHVTIEWPVQTRARKVKGPDRVPKEAWISVGKILYKTSWERQNIAEFQSLKPLSRTLEPETERVPPRNSAQLSFTIPLVSTQ